MNKVIEEDIKTILASDADWEKLRGARVLVTGATGMLGSWVISVLKTLNEQREYGIAVFAVVRSRRKAISGISNIIQDVTDPIVTDAAKDGFDYVIHLASPASPKIMAEDPAGTIAANTLGTWNTLELARKSGAKGYLFLSSREVYGQPAEGQDFFTEDTYGTVDPLDPRSCYPEGKKAAETMCVCFREQYGLNAKIARLTHTFGPGMSLDDGRVQADFLRDVVNGRDIVLKSDGSSVRSYLYVADAVSAIFRILLDEPGNETGEAPVYNISDEDAAVSIRELAETMAACFPEKEIGLKFEIPEGGTKGTAPFTKGILKADRLRALGWEPAFGLEEGIRRTVAFFAPGSQD